MVLLKSGGTYRARFIWNAGTIHAPHEHCDPVFGGNHQCSDHRVVYSARDQYAAFMKKKMDSPDQL